jgi:hypothetical protein
VAATSPLAIRIVEAISLPATKIAAATSLPATRIVAAISPLAIRIVEAISLPAIRIVEAISLPVTKIAAAISLLAIRIVEAISPLAIRIVEAISLPATKIAAATSLPAIRIVAHPARLREGRSEKNRIMASGTAIRLHQVEAAHTITPRTTPQPSPRLRALQAPPMRRRQRLALKKVAPRHLPPAKMARSRTTAGGMATRRPPAVAGHIITPRIIPQPSPHPRAPQAPPMRRQQSLAAKKVLEQPGAREKQSKT